MSVESDAIHHATLFFEQNGYSVQNVSRDPQHKGFDLLLTRDDEVTRVEVKGCSRPWQIPDPYVTEFDSDRRLVADYLCVVYLMNPNQPVICQIPRDAIPPEWVQPKSGYRISGRLKKRKHLEQYVKPYHLTRDA